MDWFASFVIDVDSEMDDLKRTVEALGRSIPRGGECVFVCDREKRDMIEWLLEAAQIVLVPREGAGIAQRLNAGAAICTGDPVTYLLASRPPERGFFEPDVFQLMRESPGVVVMPDAVCDSRDEESRAGCISVARRTLDTLGSLEAADSAYASFLDLVMRARAADFPVTFSAATVGDTARPCDVAGFDEVARRHDDYEAGVRPLHVARERFRVHQSHAPFEQLSLAMVTHKRFDYLARTWDRFWESAPTLDPEAVDVVFADNGSEPDVREWLFERDAWVVLNPANWGIPVARNQALALTTGDPIVMIDPDILLPDGWFDVALDVLSLPGIGFSAVSEEDRTYEVVDLDGTKVEVKHGNIAGVWIIPRRTIEVLGYFNEEYLYYGGEDSDYGHRIILAGWLNTYLPDLKGDHLGAGDGVYSRDRTDYVKMKAKWWDLNNALFRRRAQEYESGERPLRVERDKHLLQR